MDNITHSLVGALVGVLAVRKGTRREVAQGIIGVSIISNNFPDADLLYAPYFSTPLGYLLHHRGHTHTFLGAICCSIFVWLLAELFFRIKNISIAREERLRLALVALLGGFLHICLDWLNTYGVHPFWPISNQWVYGDTIFIVEPLLWFTLSLAILRATGSFNLRLLTGAIALGAIGLIVFSGYVPVFVIGYFFSLFLLFENISRHIWKFRRSLIWILASMIVLLHFVVLGFFARNSPEYLQDKDRTIISFLSPSPANPFCWKEYSATKTDQAILYKSKFIAPLEQWIPLDCESHALGQPKYGADTQISVPLSLFEATSSDCNWRAFLQFSRIPILLPCGTGSTCFDDYRFVDQGHRHFSRFEINQPICPTFLPPWEPSAISFVSK